MADHPQDTETIDQTISRLGGADDVVQGNEPQAVVNAPESAAMVAKAPATKAEARAASADLAEALPDLSVAQLKAVALKNGFVFDDERVTAKERSDWRDKKRRDQQYLQTRESELVQQFAERDQQFLQRFGQADALVAAAEKGDYEELARMLGHSDWTKLTEHIVAQNSDPSFREVMALKRENAERKRREEEYIAQQRQQQTQQAQGQQLQQERQAVAEACSASTDPLVAAFADDPIFLNSIHAILRANHDGDGTVSLEQAVRMRVPGGSRPVIEELRAMKARLDKAFAGSVAAQAEPPASAAKPPKPLAASIGKSPKSPTKTAPSVEPSTARQETTEEWTRRGIRALQRASLEDDS